MKITFIKNYLPDLPISIKVFLKRALVIFVIWKLLYHLLLLPIRIPDAQLTFITANSTKFVCNLFHAGDSYNLKYDYISDPDWPLIALYKGNNRILGIADPCNGLELYVLYIGFLFCFKDTVKRRILFILLGVSVIYITNILRCYGLAWLSMNNSSYTNFAHHYFFKMIIYGLVFYIWMIYGKDKFSNSE